jgi:hypothetical protein
MARKAFTKAETSIVENARRRVTKLEKILSRGRFSLGGEYFVSASVKEIKPSTAYLTVSRVKDFLLGASHGTATAQRKAGERQYASAATEAQAEKQTRKKATLESKTKRMAKAKRHAKLQKKGSEAGIARGKNQRQKMHEFIEEKMAQHDVYLATGRGKLSEDDYNKAVHWAYEYNFDEERMERMKDSFELAVAAE